jgi:hypothetical protein
MPPRALDEWERVEEVTRIEYRRSGTKAPGDFFHKFGDGRWFRAFIPGKLPTLYRRGSIYRLELGKGCAWDDRGISHP